MNKYSLRRLPRWLWIPSVTYVSARVATLLVLSIINAFNGHSLRAELTRWDTKWYIKAATSGWPRHLVYVHGHVKSSTLAFFPTLPLAIRWFADITGLSPLQAGLVISFLTGLTATLAIALLVREFTNDREATKAAVVFALFPAAYIFNLVYAEGIMLTCIALGLYCLLKSRWLYAGLLGALAAFTGPVALAFFVPCVYAALREIHLRRSFKALIAPVLAPLGFLGFLVWSWRHTGVGDAWRLTERGGWKGYPSLWYTPHLFIQFVRDPIAQVITTWIVVGFTIFALVGLYLAWRRRQPMVVLLYGVASTFLAFISAPVGLRPRFVLMAFPILIAYSTTMQRRRWWILLGLSVAFLVTNTLFELFDWAVFP